MEDYKKRYEEALSQAEKELKCCGSLDCDAARQIFRLFPELKESEDERIKKAIKEAVEYYWSDDTQARTDVFVWLKKQGEQKFTCLLDNSKSNVKFPFKAKVKSNGKIVTIHDGELSMDGKEWIKYQSDVEDGYTVYESEDLELVCNIEQKPAWSEEDERNLSIAIQYVFQHGYLSTVDWLKSLKERMKGE